MKVILLNDVPKLGKKGDVKEVADGYGRNFLIARGLAVLDTNASKKILDEQKKQEEANDAQRRKEANELKDLLATKTLEFKLKANNGKVSGSVSGKQIEDALSKQNITIDKRKIKDSSPLNELGTYDVKIELYKDIVGTIKVKLVEE